MTMAITAQEEAPTAKRGFPASAANTTADQSAASLANIPVANINVGPHSRRSGPWTTAISLFVGDFVAFGASAMAGGVIAYAINFYVLKTAYVALQGQFFAEQLAVLTCVMTSMCVWFARAGHYTERRMFRSDLAGIWNALLIGLLINGFVEFANKTNFSRLWLCFAWLAAVFAIPLARVSIRHLLAANDAWVTKAIIVGKGAHGTSVKESLSRDHYLGYDVATDGSLGTYVDSAEHTVDEKLDALLEATKAQTVILVPNDEEMRFLPAMINALNIRMMPYFVVPPIEKMPLAGLTMQSFLSSDAVLLTVRTGLTSPLSQITKRAFDIAASLAMLVVLAPLFIFVSSLVALDGGGIFFAHERVGRRGRVFKCLKFRTMVPNATKALEQLLAQQPEARREWMKTQKLRNDPRVTRLGVWLRATSIAELPQLFNVLRGEMSLVGPRPVVRHELIEHYKGDDSYYLLVRPGVTGLWQVSGRNDTDYARRVHLDSWYVRNWSLWSDIIILLRTLPVVWRGSGAY